MSHQNPAAIRFYEPDKPYGCLSNLSSHPVELDGHRWPTSEHYYQSRKFIESDDQLLIKNLEDPIDAWRMTRKMHEKVRPDWDNLKEVFMKKVLLAKALQHKIVWETLRSTENLMIVEEAADDPYWGTGEDGNGKNRLGVLWMEVREMMPANFPPKNIDFDADIMLENQRVRIRPISISDVALLEPLVVTNPNLTPYSPTPIYNIEDLISNIKTTLLGRQNANHYPFLIFDKHTNQYAGCTSFGNISNKDRRLEIGWTWIGREFQRTGLNRHCKFLLLRYAFEELAFERVELKTDARNLQSRKAIEAIGAKYEGTLRSHTLMSDGYRRDTVYYSILKEEWPAVKSSIFAEYE